MATRSGKRRYSKPSVLVVKLYGSDRLDPWARGEEVLQSTRHYHRTGWRSKTGVPVSQYEIGAQPEVEHRLHHRVRPYGVDWGQDGLLIHTET